MNFLIECPILVRTIRNSLWTKSVNYLRTINYNNEQYLVHKHDDWEFVLKRATNNLFMEQTYFNGNLMCENVHVCDEYCKNKC